MALTMIWPYQQLLPFFSFCQCGQNQYGLIIAVIMANIGVVLKSKKKMQITRENGFKNTLIFHQLWSKQFTDQNYGHLGLFQVKNMVFRGSTSHVSSDLILMFLESGEHVEWGQLASYNSNSN